MAAINELTDARARLVSKVPDELWLEIFFLFIPQEYFQTEHEHPYAPRTDGAPLRHDYTVSYFHFLGQKDRARLREAMAMVRSLTLVNKRWYQIAIKVLYSVVLIDTEDTAVLFCRSLDETHGNPKLGVYVYHLLLGEDSSNPYTARYLNSVLHLMHRIRIASLWRRMYAFPLFPTSSPSDPESILGSQTLHATLHLLSQVCGNTLRKLYFETRSLAFIPLTDKAVSSALSNMTNLRSLILDTNKFQCTFSLPSSAEHLTYLKFSEDLFFHPISLPGSDPPFPSLTHMHLSLGQADRDAIEGNKLLERQGPHCSVLTIDCSGLKSSPISLDAPVSLDALFSYFPHVEQLNYIMLWNFPVLPTSLPPCTTHLVIVISEESMWFEAAEEEEEQAAVLGFIAALQSLASTPGETAKLEKVTIADGNLALWLQENVAAATNHTPLVAEYGSMRIEGANGNPLEIFSTGN